jgi:hypothetical protein
LKRLLAHFKQAGSKMNFKTPVLVIGFNRPDLLSHVLNDNNLLDRKVYISIDGPRDSTEETSVNECVEKAERFKLRHLNTRIRTSQSNLGCKLGVSAAIDWVFNYENEAIILEDDVVPNDFFYVFMDKMLHKHRENHDIWQVSGHCALPSELESMNIYLSQFPQIWGWATWKSRWEKYDRNLESWSGTFLLNSGANLLVNKSTALSEYWAMRLNECKSGFDTWDYQWVYSMWVNSAWALSPGRSLCANQGFDERATHTKNADFKHRDRSIASTAHVDLTQKPEFNSQLEEVVSYISYGIMPSKDNIHYRSIRKAALKDQLLRIASLRNPILIAKKIFWTTFYVLRIDRILNALGIWRWLRKINGLLFKPRH